MEVMNADACWSTMRRLNARDCQPGHGRIGFQPVQSMGEKHAPPGVSIPLLFVKVHEAGVRSSGLLILALPKERLTD
jgi:hypothetical protein